MVGNPEVESTSEMLTALKFGLFSTFFYQASLHQIGKGYKLFGDLLDGQ